MVVGSWLRAATPAFINDKPLRAEAEGCIAAEGLRFGWPSRLPAGLSIHTMPAAHIRA